MAHQTRAQRPRADVGFLHEGSGERLGPIHTTDGDAGPGKRAYHVCLWLLELGHDLDPETSFSDQFIDAYMSGPMSKAPDTRRRNTLYYLRQLNPRRTGPRPSPVSVARDAPVPAQYLLAGEELPVADVAEVIATYVPKNVDPVRFGRVPAEFVRSAVAVWAAKTSTKAVNVLCLVHVPRAWADAVLIDLCAPTWSSTLTRSRTTWPCVCVLGSRPQVDGHRSSRPPLDLEDHLPDIALA